MMEVTTKNSLKYSNLNSSWDHFYSRLLSWRANSLIHAFSLDNVIKNCLDVKTEDLYFELMLKLCFEETRATIQQELTDKMQRCCSFSLCSVYKYGSDHMFIVEFRIVDIGVNSDNFRGGCVFQLSHHSSKFTDSNHYDQQLVDNTQKIDSNVFKFSYLSVLALSDRQNSYRQDDIVRLVIHDVRCKTVENLVASNNAMFSVGAVWSAQYGGNVLSLERMARVCMEEPCPAFMHKLTGGGAAKHTKFSDDSNLAVLIDEDEHLDVDHEEDENQYDNVLLERIQHRFYDDSSSSSSSSSNCESVMESASSLVGMDETGCGFVIDRSPDLSLPGRIMMEGLGRVNTRTEAGFTSAVAALKERVRSVIVEESGDTDSIVGKRKWVSDGGETNESAEPTVKSGLRKNGKSKTAYLSATDNPSSSGMAIAPCLGQHDGGRSPQRLHPHEEGLTRVDALLAEADREQHERDAALKLVRHAPECSARFLRSLNDSQIHALRHCTRDMLTPYIVRRNDDDQEEDENDAIHAEYTAYSTSSGGLCVVQGPPGCGKTHVLSALLHTCAATEQRVLVCAASNKAVCVTLEKFLLSGGGRLAANLAIVGVEGRIDACSSADPLRNYENATSAGEWVESVDESFKMHPALAILTRPRHVSDLFAANYGRRVDLALSTLSCEVRLVGLFNGGAVTEMSDVLLTTQMLSQTFSHIVKCISDRLPQFVPLTARNRLQTVEAGFSKLVNVLTGCIKKSDSEGVDGNDYRLSRDENEVVITDDVHVESTQRVALECDVDFDSFLEKTSPSKSLNHDQKKLIVSAVDEIQRALWEAGALFADGGNSLAINDDFVQTADFLFCTLSCAGNVSVTRNFRNIDLLLIDEAAQAFEPELLVPMALLPKNMVLFGDPMQLPATVMSQEIRNLGLDRSVMQRLMLDCRHPFCLLDTQYRMHPAIARFSSRHFYNGQVRDAESVSVRDSILPRVGGGGYRVPGWLAGNCSFLDVEGTEQRGSRQGGRSLENLHEAQFIAHLVRYLRDQWALDLTRQVCILSFYAAQVHCIQECLAALGLGGGQVQVLSVDSFQGSESDCVILSFVRSNAHGDVGFVKELRRLNVALTRARRLMLSVGSAKTLESFGARDAGNRVLTSKQSSNDAAADASPTVVDADLTAVREMMKDLRQRNRVFSGSDALCDFNSSVLRSR